MSKTSLNGILSYENRWMRISELGVDENANSLLCKEIKEDAINPVESWNREKFLAGVLNTISLFKEAGGTRDGNNKRSYIIPKGSSLLALINENSLEMSERLKVASELIQITLELHAKKYLFCDLNPALFWYDQIDEVTYLIDTIMTVESDKLSEQYSTVIGIEPDMYCMSPEHTLYANANLDFRSNYYSLGIILYALFTGTFPIISSDRVSVIYKHLSQLPMNPTGVNSELGAGLGAFIMKLLSKDPNERYQSATGLRNDFDVCSRLQSLGDLDVIPELGIRDFPATFSIPKSVFFRKEAHMLLMDMIKRPGDGQKSLALIQEDGGTGTAYLLDSFFEELNYNRFYVGYGNYSSEDSIPFKGLKDVTSEILHQVLMEDSDFIQELKSLLNHHIGNLSGVLIDFDRDFQYLFDSHLEVKDLIGNAAINRFVYAYTEFLRILELQGKSIIIALGNFNSADIGTTMLITQLLKSSVMQGIFVVLGLTNEQQALNEYSQKFLKDAEMGFDSQEPPRIEKISLDNYGQEQIFGILEALKLEPSKELGEILYEKTKGNISFINQFLTEISAHHHIRPNDKRKVWEVDLQEVQKFDISHDLNEFLENRISQLPEDEQEVLKAAASIGQEVEVYQLLRILRFDTTTSERLINNLRTSGFFTPLEYHNARLVKLKFSQLGFISVLLRSIGKEELEAYKISLLEALVESMDENQIESRLYEVVAHLLPLQVENSLPYVEYLEKAAYKAKKETAFSNAGIYFSKLSEIDREREEVNQEKIFENTFESTICTLYAMDYKLYKRMFSRLEKLADSKVQRSRLFLLRAIEAVQREDYKLTLDILEEGLKAMRIPFKQSITKVEIIKMFILNLWRSRNWNETSISKIPLDKDEIRGIYQRLINISAPAVYFLKPQLTSRLNYIGIRDAKNGLNSQTPYHLMAFGFQINSFSNSIKKSHKMSRLSHRLIEEKIATSAELVPVNFLYYSFIKHTERPLEECISSLEENYKKAREQGNISLAHYSLGMNRWYFLFNGTPLDRLMDLLNASHKLCLDDNQGLIDDFHKLLKTLIFELSRGEFRDVVLMDPELPVNWNFIESGRFKHNRILLSNLIMIRMIIEASNNRVIQDPKWIKMLLDTVKEGGNGSFNAILHIFYSCYHYFKSDKKAAVVTEKEVEKFIKVIEVRAETAPFNYRVKYLMIKGLQAQSNKEIKEAIMFFNEAYLTSLEYNNLWDMALSAELYGVSLREVGHSQAALQILSRSVDLYRQWGASSTANRIMSDYPEIADYIDHVVNSSDTAYQEEITIARRMNSMLHWSIDIFRNNNLDDQVSTLLDRISEEAIAERAVFVIKNESQYTIYASKSHGMPMEVINTHADKSILPLTILRLTERRKKHLVIGDAINSPQYRTDSYISANLVRSILCIPFYRGNEIKSFIYLENNQLNDVFEDVNLTLINWMFSQIAVSIDNEILTVLLEDKLEQRSLQIKQERDKANELITNILPKKVADELKTYGRVKAQKFENVSVLFTDFKDFSIFSEKMDADQIIYELDECFKEFDRIVEKYNLEKIKTIGDSYMCAGGMPEPVDRHEYLITQAGLDMLKYIDDSNRDRESRGISPMTLRVGIHTGPLIAGIVGLKKYAYDIWGPTVNIASRMESSGETGKLNISGSMYLKVKDKFDCTYRGKVSAKNIGEVDMYFVNDSR